MSEERLTRLAEIRARAVEHQAKADEAYAELQREVAAALDAGESASEIARRLGVNRVSVYRMADRGRSR